MISYKGWITSHITTEAATLHNSLGWQTGELLYCINNFNITGCFAKILYHPRMFLNASDLYLQVSFLYLYLEAFSHKHHNFSIL